MVAGYRAASWVFGHVPQGITVPVMELVFLAGYLAWPARRRIVEANASHVLGVPPGDPQVGRHARNVYRLYARYIVDLMRLPWVSAEAVARSFSPHHGATVDAFARLYERLQGEGRGMIVVSAHVGCIEEFIASMAGHGWPVYGVADDSAYPELYALLERQRARWGVQEIAWRNLRQVFRVLRERSMLALLIDWGYRPEDVPVRLFGAWTTLPAGPAVLAGRTGAAIVPVVNRRRDDGRLEAEFLDPIEVPDPSPEAVARATQAIADALEQMIRPAPAQWHAFKPMWPATEAEVAALVKRAVPAGAAEAAGGVPAAGDAVRRQPPGNGRGTFAQRLAVRLVRVTAAVAMRTPDGLSQRAAHVAGTFWYVIAPGERAMARANLGRICEVLAASNRATPVARSAASDPRALDRLVRSAFQHRARSYLEVLVAPRYTWRDMDPRLSIDSESQPALRAMDAALEAGVDGRCPMIIGLHFGFMELALGYVTEKHARRVVAPMETLDNEPLQDYLARMRASSGVRLVRLASARRELRGALGRGEVVAIVGDRDVSRTGAAVELFGHRATLPIGPALMAIEGSGPAYVVGIRRVGWGRYAAHVVELTATADGGLRDRVGRFLASEARAFESLIADAPEQWTAVFFPVWRDLPVGARS